MVQAIAIQAQARHARVCVGLGFTWIGDCIVYRGVCRVYLNQISSYRRTEQSSNQRGSNKALQVSGSLGRIVTSSGYHAVSSEGTYQLV